MLYSLTIVVLVLVGAIACVCYAVFDVNKRFELMSAQMNDLETKQMVNNQYTLDKACSAESIAVRAMELKKLTIKKKRKKNVAGSR